VLIGSAGDKNKSAPWKILENHQPHLKQRFGQTPYLPANNFNKLSPIIMMSYQATWLKSAPAVKKNKMCGYFITPVKKNE